MAGSRLQYISQGNTFEEQLNNIISVLDAGCEWVQLRFKKGQTEELRKLAYEVRKLCNTYSATFILNDHTILAKEVDADGVHLGLSDMHVKEARQILSQGKIIGGTANTIDDIKTRINEGCDYIGLGPFKYTATKEKLSPLLGLNGIKQIMNEINNTGSSIPIYAIGGIRLKDIPSIFKIGVYGVAVSGDLTNSNNKKEWIRDFKRLCKSKTKY